MILGVEEILEVEENIEAEVSLEEEKEMNKKILISMQDMWEGNIIDLKFSFNGKLNQISKKINERLLL